MRVMSTCARAWQGRKTEREAANRDGDGDGDGDGDRDGDRHGDRDNGRDRDRDRDRPATHGKANMVRILAYIRANHQTKATIPK